MLVEYHISSAKLLIVHSIPVFTVFALIWKMLPLKFVVLLLVVILPPSENGMHQLQFSMGTLPTFYKHTQINSKGVSKTCWKKTLEQPKKGLGLGPRAVAIFGPRPSPWASKCDTNVKLV